MVHILLCPWMHSNSFSESGLSSDGQLETSVLINSSSELRYKTFKLGKQTMGTSKVYVKLQDLQSFAREKCLRQFTRFPGLT